MSSRLRVLAVCTHNRTRSVLIQELFDHHAQQAGLAVIVKSASFHAGGEAPTDTTVRLLQARGIDATGNRSLTLNTNGVTGANLIVTAEKAHVISIVGRWPQAFTYTFTLPEIAARGEHVGPRGERTFEQWIDAVNAERPTALDYLDSDVGEIVDPTGGPPAGWSTCFAQIDELTAGLTRLLG